MAEQKEQQTSGRDDRQNANGSISGDGGASSKADSGSEAAKQEGSVLDLGTLAMPVSVPRDVLLRTCLNSGREDRQKAIGSFSGDGGVASKADSGGCYTNGAGVDVGKENKHDGCIDNNVGVGSPCTAQATSMRRACLTLAQAERNSVSVARGSVRQRCGKPVHYTWCRQRWPTARGQRH